jgi:hypothetical protein
MTCVPARRLWSRACREKSNRGSPIACVTRKEPQIVRLRQLSLSQPVLRPNLHPRKSFVKVATLRGTQLSCPVASSCPAWLCFSGCRVVGFDEHRRLEGFQGSPSMRVSGVLLCRFRRHYIDGGDDLPPMRAYDPGPVAPVPSCWMLEIQCLLSAAFSSKAPQSEPAWIGLGTLR